ncbi:MAG: tRNA pseudouridine(13) synthase TruD [Candidatus Thermoplasmatota archaeon]
MLILDAERAIGIDTFFSKNKGIGGKLRFLPDDFIVDEISVYPPKKENGAYTIAEVSTKNWETNLLIRTMAKRLHIARSRISFSGTKDKRATTTRLMSFMQVPLETLNKLKIKNVEIKNAYTSDKPVTIGDHVGNSFSITIRNIEPMVTVKDIKDTLSPILSANGFPNFYGIQRFGITRPLTHLIGKHIILGEFKEAVMTYIAEPFEGEDEQLYSLRKRVRKTNDYSEALKQYPDNLTFEKAILNRLVNKPDDFINALTVLPKNLLTMFVYAYQSYIFNKILSERIKKGLPLNQAIPGDIVVPMSQGITKKDYSVVVTPDNITKVNKQLNKGRACVTGLLIGHSSLFAKGEMGEIEHDIINSEKIDPRDFIVPELPFLSSAGSRRSLLARLLNFKYEYNEDNLNPGKKALHLEFTLDKGCYATSLLREIMKADNIKCY